MIPRNADLNILKTTSIDKIIYEVYLNDKVSFVNGSRVASGEIVIRETIDYEGVTYPVTLIGQNAFQYCEELTSAIIPEGITNIKTWAFFGCKKLKYISLPGSISTIGKSVFYGCSSLEVVSCGKGVSMSPINNILEHSRNLKYIILDQADIFKNKKIVEYVFNYIADNPNLYDIELIKKGFKKKKEFVSLILNLANPKIISFLFENNIPQYNLVKELMNELELDSECKTLFLNYLNTATSEDKKELKEESVRKEDIEIGLEKCKLKDVKEEWKCSKKDNKIYFKSYIGVKPVVTIPSSIDGISNYVFEPLLENNFLTELIFAEGVKGVDFEPSIKREYNSTYYYSTFNKCSKFAKITLPNTLDYLNIQFQFDDTLEFNCSGVDINSNESVYLGNVLISLGSSDIEDVIVKDGTTCIQILQRGKYKKLKTISIPESVESLGSYSFHKCTNLSKINIPNNISIIGINTFSYCEELKDITLPDNLQYIGGRAFYDSALTNISLPKTVNEIGDDGFNGCNITSVIIPDGVINLSNRTFMDCRKLKEVTLPDSIKIIGEKCFSKCELLKDIVIPKNVTTIEGSAFSYCEEITKITFPKSVKKIEGFAMGYCSNLKTIIFEDGINIDRFSWGTFLGCVSLDNVVLPEGLKNIGESAFDGCTSLTNITVPSTVTKINKKAFTNCTALKNRPKM